MASSSQNRRTHRTARSCQPPVHATTSTARHEQERLLRGRPARQTPDDHLRAIAVIGRETSVERGRSLRASARDVPLMTSVDGTLMTRQVGSKDHRRSTHYESAPDRTTQVNARIDLGLAVCWWWLLAVNGCLRAS